jgi:hypothetical protein
MSASAQTKKAATPTPGPWQISDSGYANSPFVIFVGRKRPDYSAKYPLNGCDWLAEIRCDESERHEEFKANARTMAVAGELLAALKALVQQLGPGTCVSDMESGDARCISLNRAKAAIRAAEGHADAC